MAAMPQELMAELDECIGEFMWGSLVFYRQWGVQARDLLLRPPEWCALCESHIPEHPACRVSVVVSQVQSSLQPRSCDSSACARQGGLAYAIKC